MANKVEIVRYEDGHGAAVADRMRLCDRKEIYYLAMLTAPRAVALTAGISVGRWTGLVDGVPACIFGVARRSLISPVGVPWLLATDLMDTVPRIVAKESRTYFKRIQAAFPVLENHVLAENVQTVRWLRWLGFDMEEPAPYGAFGAPFIRFGKGLDQCV